MSICPNCKRIAEIIEREANASGRWTVWAQAIDEIYKLAIESAHEPTVVQRVAEE